jgi:hypothetical protein
MTKREIYSKALYSYGFYTLCYLINEYEQAGNYEECQIIFDTIKDHNQSMHNDLPTKYDAEAKMYLRKAYNSLGLSGEIAMSNIPSYAEKVKELISESHE